MSVLKDMKNLENCYWNRPEGDDCSQWNFDKVSKQLDWCEKKCNRYYNCFQVGYLNDRLVEIEREEK